MLRPGTVRWGSGPLPALLLHGFTGCGHSFDHLTPLLRDLVSARCPDLSGHHGAPLPRAIGTAGFDEAVEGLARRLRRPTVVIGYSQGGRLALALAVRHPEKVLALVLEGANPGLRKPAERAARCLSDEALARSLEQRGLERFVDAWERLPLFAGLRDLPGPERAALRARRLEHAAAGLAGALRCLGQGVQPDLWPALAGLTVPTLLLTGSRDVRYSRLALRMSKQLPVARRVAIRGAGHAPHLERPTVWADAVRTFLSQLPTLQPQEART